MTARAEADPLTRVGKIGLALIIFPFQPAQVHQHGFRGRLSGEWRERIVHDTGHGCTFQISLAYSAMVRSLENFPEPATFKIALLAHALGSRYKSMSRSSASR